MSAGNGSDRAIETRDLVRSFGNRRALDGVDLEIPGGEIFGLLGPNGGGKTTLFRILTTLLPADAGTARVAGRDVAADPAGVRAAIGVVFQKPSLDPVLTVAENLMHQGHLYGLRGRELGERIGTLLDRFGLSDRAGDRAGVLSGGLARRVEIAKGLLHRPRILLLDEPSTGLDPVARRDLFEMLEEARRTDGTTVVLTTHILEEAARCDRVGILDRGHLVACDDPDRLVGGIGRDVLLLESESPEDLSEAIAERFDVDAAVRNGEIRIEHPKGAAFLAEVIEVFGDRIARATVAHPTLEDVFFHRTGRPFDMEAPDG